MAGGGGDYARKRTIYQDVSTNLDFTASTDDTTLITGKTGYTVYVQKIDVTIKTSAAQSITFEDSNSSAVYVAKIGASPGADTKWSFDFGPEGKALTTAKNLVMNVSAAGNAGHLQVQAYLRPDAVVAA